MTFPARTPHRLAILPCAALAALMFSAPAQAQTPPGQPPPPATAPPPEGYPPNLQAGGLTPPPSNTPTTTAGQTQTEQDLERAKKEDSKRGLEWFWINAEGGFSHVNMQTFTIDDDTFALGFTPTEAIGGVTRLGLGVRLLFITIGARGGIGFYDPWHMFTVGGEIGFHIPLGRVEPHFELGGGYAALGNVNSLVKGSTDAISIRGGYGRVSGGLDVYVTPVFSIGLQASGDFLALVRPGLTQEAIDKIKADPSVAEAQRQVADGLGFEGSSYGTAIGVTGVLGLHF